MLLNNELNSDRQALYLVLIQPILYDFFGFYQKRQ